MIVSEVLPTYPGQDFKRMPVRCEANNPFSCEKCREFLAIPGSAYCPRCKGPGELDLVRKGLYRFHSAEAQARLQGMKSHTEGRTLANEVALLRILLETQLNKCSTEYDLLTNEATISRLIENITKCLTANNKMEERIGELLTLEQVIMMLQSFFNMVIQYIPDPEQQEKIAIELNAMIHGHVEDPHPVHTHEHEQPDDFNDDD